MPKRYNYDITDPANSVKAALHDVKVSFKNTRETCSTLRGRSFENCVQYLNNVIAKKECVPMRRYCSGVHATPQARAFSGKVECVKGRWPASSCKTMIRIMDNIKANALQKNIDVKDLVIKMVSVNRARIIPGRCFRAHGRVNAFNKSPCHIQMVCVKKSEHVPENGEIVEVDE